MSTSKKRRAARVWMQEERVRSEREQQRAAIAGQQKGEHLGAERMRRDMELLIPRRDRSYEDERGVHCFSTILEFPNPREKGPSFVVPLPLPPLRNLGPIPESVSFLKFRPVENCFRQDFLGGSATLRWYTWEPEKGDDELSQHTKALFTGWGKLSLAASMLRSRAFFDPGLAEPMKLIEEAAAELRRRLGKYAPTNHPTEPENARFW